MIVALAIVQGLVLIVGITWALKVHGALLVLSELARSTNTVAVTALEGVNDLMRADNERMKKEIARLEAFGK